MELDLGDIIELDGEKVMFLGNYKRNDTGPYILVQFLQRTRGFKVKGQPRNDDTLGFWEVFDEIPFDLPEDTHVEWIPNNYGYTTSASTVWSLPRLVYELEKELQ